MPLTMPASATIIIFNFIHIWNDFFVPLVFISNRNIRPIQLAIYSFVGEFSSEWNVIFACMTMAMIPVILTYVFLQKYFISGIMSGAIKG